MQNQMECEIDLEKRKMYLLQIHYLTFLQCISYLWWTFQGLIKCYKYITNSDNRQI